MDRIRRVPNAVAYICVWKSGLPSRQDCGRVEKEVAWKVEMLKMCSVQLLVLFVKGVSHS